jgi:hypothetical protein
MLAYRVQPGALVVATLVVDGMATAPLNGVVVGSGEAKVDRVGSGLPAALIGTGGGVGVTVLDGTAPLPRLVQATKRSTDNIDKTTTYRVFTIVPSQLVD